MKRIIQISLVVGLGVCLSSCLAPPFLFKKVEMYGRVLDQDGNPIAGVPLQCNWSPVRFLTFVNPMASMYHTPQYTEDFVSDTNGYWRTSHRKVQGYMCVKVKQRDNVRLAEGYSIIPGKPWIVGYNPNHIGCPTNPFTIWVKVENNMTEKGTNKRIKHTR